MTARAKLAIVPRRTQRDFTQTQIWGVIERFLRYGESRHSREAQTLQHVIDYCESNGIAYQVTAWPGQGYLVRKSTHGRV